MSSDMVIFKPTTTTGDKILLVSALEKNSRILVSALWIFSSIFSAAKYEFGPNTTGISIGFTLLDVLLIMVTSWMLHKGLSKRIVALILPWIVVSTYGLYFNHYKSLIKMIGILNTMKYSSALPWISLFIVSLALVLRLILILQTLHLSSNIWLKKNRN